MLPIKDVSSRPMADQNLLSSMDQMMMDGMLSVETGREEGGDREGQGRGWGYNPVRVFAGKWMREEVPDTKETWLEFCQLWQRGTKELPRKKEDVSSAKMRQV